MRTTEAAEVQTLLVPAPGAKNSTDLVRWLVSFIIGLIGAVITVTLFVASRPDRTEVRQMINDSVNNRLQNIEDNTGQLRKDVGVIQDDIKEILKRKK
ncbi:MAG TPA: hypothetical protein VHO03_03660 [Ignavibacteriales bacterium]|nr:hypothetical protein [Ignavibacteriales bacterium]